MQVTHFFERIFLPSRLNLGDRTVAEYQTVLRHLDRWTGRPLHIDEIDDDLVCRFLRNRLKSGASAATVNGNRAKVLALWRCAWRKRLLDDLPRDVPKLREPRDVPRAWTVGDVARLAAHCGCLEGRITGIPKKHYWQSLVVVAWESGERVGALRQTTTDNCSIEERTLLVRANSTKTGQAKLYSLSEEAVAAIAPILRPSQVLLWPWPYSRRWFFVQFRRIVEAAGLTAGNHHDLFHKLRRSNLTYTAKGGGIELARQQAGHDSVRTTLKHYVDPRIARQRSAVDVLPPLVLEQAEGAR